MEKNGFLDNIDKEAEKRYPFGTTPPMPVEACAYHNAAQQRLRDTFKEAAIWGYEQANTFSGVAIDYLLELLDGYDNVCDALMSASEEENAVCEETCQNLQRECIIRYLRMKKQNKS